MSTDVSSIVANLDAIDTRLNDLDAECLSPSQVYTAAALHALLSRLDFTELKQMAADPADLRTLAGMALAFGDAVYRREWETLAANSH